ncbi:MAG: hypothetical protein KC466_04490 [Myxococcales bacterium]|nr:hypothetical protein [Myxococcales bacterium]
MPSRLRQRIHLGGAPGAWARAVAFATSVALSAIGCPAKSSNDSAATDVLFERIDAHIERANDLSLSNHFFDSLREAQYGLSLARDVFNDKRRVLDIARAQAKKADPSERLDMDRLDLAGAREAVERAGSDLAYFNEKINFTFMRMIEGLVADDAETVKAARESFKEFCDYEHPAFDELRVQLLTDNRLRIEKIAYAHPGDVSKLLYDCLRSSSY